MRGVKVSRKARPQALNKSDIGSSKIKKFSGR
jgi:hypothetical protein